MATYASFDNTVTLITGGAQGIGKCIALKLLEQGAKLVIWDINPGPLEELRQIAPDQIEASVVDVTQKDQIDAGIKAAINRFGSLDYLVNNAGIIGKHMSVKSYDEMEFDRVINTNLKSCFLVSNAFINAPSNVAHRSIVNLSSIAARTGGMVGSIAYATTKGAIKSFTVALAKELAPHVRVNAMSPGVIDTDIQKAVFKNPEDIAAMANLIPMKRLGKPEEVADCALWLLSDAASYVTGVTIDISGGR